MRSGNFLKATVITEDIGVGWMLDVGVVGVEEETLDEWMSG